MSQPTIQKGSTGGAVKFCQERLITKGFAVVVDGEFGKATEAAVEQFQAACNLPVDGIVGSLTWALLVSRGQVKTPREVLDASRASLTAKIPVDCPSDARAVLEAAIAKLGCREIPDGSNGGPELASIVGGSGRTPSAYYVHWNVTDASVLRTMPPWCVLFVCYALRAGLNLSSWSSIPFGNWFGGVQQIEDWGKKKGKWMSPLPAIVQPGVVFTISRDGSSSDPSKSVGAGHAGLVICDNGDGTVTTIEGNVSNAVGSHKREKVKIRGIVTWW